MNVKPAQRATQTAAGVPLSAQAVPPVPDTDADFRHTSPAALAAMLQACRCDTLATFARYEQALARQQLAVRYHPELNPPLWELGHIGWFQAHWLARNPEWLLGLQANPAAARLPAARADVDAMYNSSLVPHATRWQLPLPDATTTRAEVAAVLDESLAMLNDGGKLTGADSPETLDRALYFHRLCLAHEDMHHEAALYMAQALGLPLLAPSEARFQPHALPAPGPSLQLPAGPYTLGTVRPQGFAFDNECGTQHHHLTGCSIDCQVLRWRDYLPFVEAGGYTDPRWWPGRAAAWRAAPGNQAPRYLRLVVVPQIEWHQWRNGDWQTLNLDEPACHLTAYEADAWCAWAGRRLPTEAEWECAARSHPAQFNWGAVWEWTASGFGAYEGFVAHPYRDYSEPWFGSRRVLRGASVATQPRLRHVAYRNFYTPDRNDILAGFRSCAA